MTSADRQRRYRERKAAAEGRELGKVGRPAAEHGTGSRYARGCRCAECRQAHTERIRQWRARRTTDEPSSDRERTGHMIQPGDPIEIAKARDSFSAAARLEASALSVPQSQRSSVERELTPMLDEIDRLRAETAWLRSQLVGACMDLAEVIEDVTIERDMAERKAQR